MPYVFYVYIYIHMKADVKALAGVIVISCVVDGKPLRQMLSPLLCQKAGVIAFFLFFVADVKPQYIYYYYSML